MVIDLSLTGILTLLLIGGIAGGVYYYRDGIANAFGQQKSEEEKDYDFDRKKKEDVEWDNSGWNPDNWFNTTKNDPKQLPKTYPISFDPNNDPSKFNPDNSQYNADNPYGYNQSTRRFN